MKRGQICIIKQSYLDKCGDVKNERPAVIVSNDKNNEHSQTVEIVYMTTQAKKYLTTHVLIKSAPRISTLLCENVYSVPKHRIGAMVGELTKDELRAMDFALKISLGIDRVPVQTQDTETEKTEDNTMTSYAEEQLEHAKAKEAERTTVPADFDAAAHLRKMAEERKALAKLRPDNARFADDVRALEYAVSVLEVLGL